MTLTGITLLLQRLKPEFGVVAQLRGQGLGPQRPLVRLRGLGAPAQRFERDGESGPVTALLRGALRHVLVESHRFRVGVPSVAARRARNTWKSVPWISGAALSSTCRAAAVVALLRVNPCKRHQEGWLLGVQLDRLAQQLGRRVDPLLLEQSKATYALAPATCRGLADSATASCSSASAALPWLRKPGGAAEINFCRVIGSLRAIALVDDDLCRAHATFPPVCGFEAFGAGIAFGLGWLIGIQ